ncbi:tafazzin [Pilobolus umbonatus]|nr:tafazzin [Pilobolus umbonatus]
MSTVVMGGAGTLSKLFLHLNHVKVVGLDSFLRVIHDPHRRQGVITVSNHESVWDDPVLWGVLPLSTLYSRQSMRWALGAADICYTNMWKSCFFALGQTIPTIRGAGIYQPGVDFAIRKMNQHGWVHIYPEAKVNIEPRMIRFKWGVGRISMEADLPPILIPIWHKGMNRVKPLYGNPSFRIGQDVLLVFGDPIVYDDILDNWKKGKISRKEARMLITSRLYDALEHMKSEYEHPE